MTRDQTTVPEFSRAVLPRPCASAAEFYVLSASSSWTAFARSIEISEDDFRLQPPSCFTISPPIGMSKGDYLISIRGGKGA